MRIYATVCVTVLALVAGSCSDAPTEPPRNVIAPDQGPLMNRNGHRKPGRADALANLPVTAVVTFTKANNVTGAFTGAFTATHVDVVTDAAGKQQLKVTGVLTGVAKSSDGTQRIDVTESVSGILTREDDGRAGSVLRPTQASCDILFLDLGPIRLDLLGLVLDVSQIVIDLNGVTGGGNLLGNLLCALLGLLDPIAVIAAVQQLLDVINSILAGVGGGTPTA
jgi:hypothetical protein